MIPLILSQLALPLALILWLGLRPLRNRVGFWLQVLAAAFAVAALALAGMGLPWWLPLLYALLLVVAAVAGHPRVQARTWPARATAWIGVIAMTGLGVLFGALAAWALAGRAPSAAEPVQLGFPFRSGEYLVVNGGSTLPVNFHLETLDLDVPGHRSYHGQSYGVDLVKVDRWGLRASGVLPRDPRSYAIFGEPVYAPCAGTVVGARDGLPDLPVPEVDRINMTGNFVLLRCAQADVLLAHLREGTVRVREGEKIAVGAPLGQIGNSGNTSEPHLHIHAQRPGTAERPFSGAPLPIEFNGRFLVRNDRVDAAAQLSK
jgi:hypothetical protein